LRAHIRDAWVAMLRNKEAGHRFSGQNYHILGGNAPKYRADFRAKCWVPMLRNIQVGILIQLAIAILLFYLSADRSPLIRYAGYLFIATAIITWLENEIEFKTTEVVVTNKRLVIKRGFIARKTFELLLTKTETVGVDQGFWGRIFNFGRVTAIGTGGSHGSADYISRPMAFRAAFQEAVELHQESMKKADA